MVSIRANASSIVKWPIAGPYNPIQVAVSCHDMSCMNVNTSMLTNRKWPTIGKVLTTSSALSLYIRLCVSRTEGGGVLQD